MGWVSCVIQTHSTCLQAQDEPILAVEAVSVQSATKPSNTKVRYLPSHNKVFTFVSTPKDPCMTMHDTSVILSVKQHPIAFTINSQTASQGDDDTNLTNDDKNLKMCMHLCIC